jgi:hypothetical protein
MKRCHDERGQAFVLMVISLTVLLGMAALVIDVGHWYRSKRDLQSIADAAALAGAQALPEDTAKAAALAAQYAQDNGGPPPQVSFSSKYLANDTISVKESRTEPGFFSRVFNVDTVNVDAKASARTGTLGAAQYAAPFGIDERQDELVNCKPDPCTNQTTLDLEKVGPGAFRILNLDNSKGGTGQQILADWILHGFGGMMPVNTDYFSDSGAKFNASEVKDAMNTAIVTGRELLFPVYRAVDGTGSNLTYTVIGWAGFVVDQFDGNGNHGSITGHFTRFIAEGIQGSGGTPGYGTWNVQLVE